VPQQVGVNALFDSGPVGRELTSVPNDFRGDRLIGTPVVDGTWKQLGLRSHPAPVLAQGRQQLGTERNIAITPTLAVLNMDEHRLAVDVLDLQMAHLGIAHAGGVEHHQHGALEKVAGGIDQACDFLHGQDGRQAARSLGIGKIIGGQGAVRGCSFRSLSR
jgi:hypothetical protein